MNSNPIYMHGYYSFTQPWCIFFTPTNVGVFFSKRVNLVSFSILVDYRWANVVAMII